MYIEYFGFKEAPFSIAPDPRFFFTSDRHKEALTHLSYGLKGAGGFVMLTGEVGTGKTTVSRALVSQLPETTVIAYVHNPAISELELLATLCDEFGLDYDRSHLTLKVLFGLLYQHLLMLFQQQQTCVVMIDEAQLLSTAALEQLRLLTNLDVEHQKLLHVVLIGQPELQQKLKQTELRQLAQRISARYHLLPLTETELASYCAYRLSIAAGNPGVLPKNVLKKLQQVSGGVPRLVNLICDKALYFAFNERSDKVKVTHIIRAADAVFISDNQEQKRSWAKHIAPLLLVLALGSGTGFAITQVLNLSESVEAVQQVNNIELAELMPAIRDSRDINLAMQTLYNRWGFSIVEQDATCRNSKFTSLRCLQKQGIFSELKQYNLPAVVMLRDNLADAYYATLLSITEGGVELAVSDMHILVSQAWFEQYWTGDYQVLWNAPKSFQRSLKMNDRGALVTWLDNTVSKYLGSPSRFTERFDDELKTKIKRFQQQNNLYVDGIVGQQTMMLLAQSADETMPNLTSESGLVRTGNTGAKDE